jgi:hypothetical protein
MARYGIMIRRNSIILMHLIFIKRINLGNSLNYFVLNHIMMAMLATIDLIMILNQSNNIYLT